MNDGNSYEVTDEFIRSKYDGYVKSIYQLFKVDADISQIVKLLQHHVTINMGTSRVDVEKQLYVATLLKQKFQ